MLRAILRMPSLLPALAVALVAAACGGPQREDSGSEAPQETLAASAQDAPLPNQAPLSNQAAMESSSANRPDSADVHTAILAGGCFWGMEDILRKEPGVVDTEVGYTGGTLENPTYPDMRTGRTGHAEAIRIQFRPAELPYGVLLDLFFRMHDPTTKNRQGNDVGSQYRSAIFYVDAAQQAEAEAAVARANQSGRWKKPVVTEITPAATFWLAEGYHQDYLEKNPGGYTCHWIRE